MTLTEFLTARLGEDEAAANAIVADPDYEDTWHEQHSGVLYVGPGSEQYPLDGLQPMGDSTLTRFIAEHDPARVLREVEAKRKILERHSRQSQQIWRDQRVVGEGPPSCGSCSDREQDYPWPCEDVLALAAVWSGHPDYDPVWVTA